MASSRFGNVELIRLLLVCMMVCVGCLMALAYWSGKLDMAIQIVGTLITSLSAGALALTRPQSGGRSDASMGDGQHLADRHQDAQPGHDQARQS